MRTAGSVRSAHEKGRSPRYLLAHKAVVIRLKDELCERLVVEVQDPEGVVEQINQAVGASS